MIVFWMRPTPSIGARGFSVAERAVLAADHQVHPAHFHSKPDDASPRSGQLLLCLAKPCNSPGAEIQQPPASLFLSCTTLLVKKVFLLNCPNPTLPATVCDCDLLLYHLLTMREVWVRHLCTFFSSTCRLRPYYF